MVGWHHWLNGWTLGVGNGQGSLVCCSSWGRKESDTTELLNWTEPPGKPSLRKVTPHLSLSVGVQDPNFKKGHPHTHTDGLIALNYLHPKSCNNLPLTHPVLKAQTFLLFQCSWAQSWNEVSFTYYSSLNKICTAIFNKRPVQFQSDTTQSRTKGCLDSASSFVWKSASKLTGSSPNAADSFAFKLPKWHLVRAIWCPRRLWRLLNFKTEGQNWSAGKETQG